MTDDGSFEMTGNPSFFGSDEKVDIYTEKLRLYTMIFNTFVFMQVFNEINSRKLGEYEFNVFKGFFNNLLFVVILLFTIAMQVLMVEKGGRPLRCRPLTVDEHLICLAFGAFSLVNGVIIKIILPAKWFNRLSLREEVMTDEEVQSSFVSAFKKSFRESSMFKDLNKVKPEGTATQNTLKSARKGSTD